jgi:transcriptional regulator with XRE-family HTH domain
MSTDILQVIAVSTFAQRFEYARDRQRQLGTWQEDVALADRIGVAASQISGYKARDDAPPAKRTLALAQICEVDPGWLAFGDLSLAPSPEGWSAWLAKRYPPRKQPEESDGHFKAVRRPRAKKKSG